MAARSRESDDIKQAIQESYDDIVNSVQHHNVDDIKQAIQESYDDIVNSVQHHNVVPKLVAREILSPQDAERIQVEKVNQDRMVR